MRVGIHFVNFTLPGEPASLASTLAETARVAEEGGVSTFTLMDHWFQMEPIATAEDPMLEGYTSLGFLAGQTQRMRLGLLVTGVTYRHPGLLAKTVTTLDVLSGGRAQLGIGAAWYEREHLGLGVPFPPLAERFERLEETLQICLQMWSDDDGPFKGKHYQLAETICSPPPVSSPHRGDHRRQRRAQDPAPRRPLRRRLQPVRLLLDDVAHKLDVLAHHCDTEGRDPATIERTILAMGNPFDDPDGFIASMAAYAKLGVDLVELMPMGDPVAYATEMVTRIVPALDEIAP